MSPHRLTKFEIQKYYENEPRFNGVFSRDNIPKTIKDGAYVINLDKYADVSIYWIALFCNGSEVVYFNNLVLSMFLKKLTLFRMGSFGTAHEWEKEGGGSNKKATPSKNLSHIS